MGWGLLRKTELEQKRWDRRKDRLIIKGEKGRTHTRRQRIFRNLKISGRIIPLLEILSVLLCPKGICG